jgi:hypothetical protein
VVFSKFNSPHELPTTPTKTDMALRASARSSSLFKPLARWYQKQVFGKMAEFGVRYEDLLVEDDDLAKAHAWAGKDEMAMRDRKAVMEFNTS